MPVGVMSFVLEQKYNHFLRYAKGGTLRVFDKFEVTL